MKKLDPKILILALTAEVAFAASASAKTIEEILGVVQSQIITPLMGFFGVLAIVFFLYGVVEFVAGASNEEPVPFTWLVTAPAEDALLANAPHAVVTSTATKRIRLADLILLPRRSDADKLSPIGYPSAISNSVTEETRR